MRLLRLRSILAALAFSGVSSALIAQSAAAPLPGTWTLAAADDLKPDGTRVPAYGTDPQGLLILGADGRYSLQIYRSDRAKFALGDKRRGTPQEYEVAVLAMSTHYGRYAVDAAAGTITFKIERAAFPNWDGTEQKRPFTLTGDELSYRVTATPDGTVPITVWRRVR
jgi:hypothetical protein